MRIIKKAFCLCLVIAMWACGNTTHTKSTAENEVQENVSVEEVKGVVFQDITLEQALEKAKNENKYVFIDFYSKTCAPCKKMEKTVFTTAECGKYVNDNFIPIKIDGEDNAEGTVIVKRYKIFIFPTYLILDPEASKVGEVSGAELDVNKFIGMLKDIIK